MRQRIITITDCLFPTRSGVLVQADLLAEGFAARGHESVMAGPAAPGPDVERYDQSRPYRTVRLPSMRNPMARGEFIPRRAKAALRDLMEQFSPTVILGQDPGLGPLAAGDVAQQVGVPYVHVHHVHLELSVSFAPSWPPLRWGARKLIIRAFRRACRAADCVIAVSEPIQAMLEGLGVRTPIRVVRNAIDTRAFCECGPPATAEDGSPLLEGPYLLFAGRLGADKPVGLLIDAFDRLDSAGMSLVIAGSGPEKEALRRRAAASPKRDRIAFLGWVDRTERLPRLYRGAYAVVLPSACEGYSLSAIEALACGAPIVVARGGGLLALGEWVPEALWFEPGSVESLAAALQALISDRCAYHAALRTGRLAVQEYSLDRMVDRYLEIIDEVTAGRCRAAAAPAR